MKWVTLFSRSGSEIYQLSKRLGRFPDLIITNKHISLIDNIEVRLRHEYKGSWVFLPSKPTTSQYLTAINCCSHGLYEDYLITLHGYLRIIPGDVCFHYRDEMYNGHPGDIIKYPILKGANPQEKAFNLKLPTSGSIIHKVTDELDSGEIIAHKEVNIENLTLDNVYSTLHNNSIDLWYEFLKERLE